MSIVLNPATSPVAAQGAAIPAVAVQGVAVQGLAAAIVLQPGTVINAQVLQVIGGDQVRIAIGGQPLDVVTQVPLQAGQTLQLSVSQAANGNINLAVVNQPATATVNPATINATSDALALAAAGGVAAPATAAAPQTQLTTLQALAVSVAAETAAAQQTSLAPLFANLAVATSSGNLPALVQQAATQVLAQRTSLDQNLTGNDIKQAFQSSGLFLESSLALGSVASGTPDLKAALIVLRQVLTTAIDQAAPATTTPTAVPLAPSDELAVTTAVPGNAASAPVLLEQGADQLIQVAPSSIVITAEAETPTTLSPALAPLLAPDIALANALAPAGAPEIPQSLLEFSAAAASVLTPATSPADEAARAAASGAALNLLQEAVQANPLNSSLAAGNASRLVFDDSMMLSLLPSISGARIPNNDAEFAHSNVPPPPISGALPAAQPVMPATLVSNSPFETAMHHLLADTDGALARQTLLQVASLPEQVDHATGRIDQVPPRWNFEIPFATAQGTAMAQFEISRDGGGTASETEAAKQAWRARFTLDVEPAGPVHALVSLAGERTSVRMWAERPATADQLRAGVAQLSQALSRAELQPGDIVIRDGAPLQLVSARAGHFLDRAL
jgi:hypothetical protein